MLMTELVRKLGRNDARLITRDSFLIFMFVFAAIIAVVFRFGLPWLDATLAANEVMPGPVIPIRLAEVFPMLVAYMAFYTGAVLVGTVFGFMLLDERDQNTLKALMVTPVSVRRYALYRTGAPAVLAFVIVLLMVAVIDQALLPLWQTVLLAAGASLAAPIIALFTATFAANKVQGFAYTKFVGISGWFIMIGWFIPTPWQWLCGLFPPFWIAKAYWLALAGSGWWWAVLAVGIVLEIGLIGWLLGRFTRVAYAN